MRNPKFTPEMPLEMAEKLYRAFLKRIENMSYEEAERELPFAAFDRFKEIYPERCPLVAVEKETNKTAPVQLELPKSKAKSKKDGSLQPRLF